MKREITLDEDLKAVIDYKCQHQNSIHYDLIYKDEITLIEGFVHWSGFWNCRVYFVLDNCQTHTAVKYVKHIYDLDEMLKQELREKNKDIHE